MARQSKLNKRNVKKSEVKCTEEIREDALDVSEASSEVYKGEDAESVDQKESFFIGDTFLDNSSISKEIKEELKKHEEKAKEEVESDYRRDEREVKKIEKKEVKSEEEKIAPIPPVHEELPSLNNTALQKKEVSAQEKTIKRSHGKSQPKEKPIQQPKVPRPRHISSARPTPLLKTLLFVLPVLLMMVIGGYYIHKLSNAPALSEQNIETGNNSQEGLVYQYGPLHPFEMCSMRKPDLIAQLGEPMGEGEGVDEETKYLRYEYEWFGLPTKSKIYYAREQRIYKAVINFHNIEFDELQALITKGIGEPLSIEEGQEYKDIIWIKDSMKYWLTQTDEGVNQLEVRLAYYPNPNDYDMGYRPTTIQEVNTVDVTGDGKPDEVSLIGSRNSYTETAYAKLFMLVTSNGKTYLEKFPEDLDGGLYPQMEISGTGVDAKITVTTDNTYVVNKNVFAFADNEIKNIESTNAPLKK